MTTAWKTMIVATVAVFLGAGLAQAATVAEKCEAAKNKIAGAYYACREKAEATSILKAAMPDYSKCDEKFDEKWDAAETTGETMCPDNVLTPAMNAYISAQAASAAAIISGAVNVPTCGDGSVNVAGEHCDGADLDGYTCGSLGHETGTLACTVGCDLDTSDCGDCTSGESVGGACWFYGAANEDCNQVCAGAGLAYDTATDTYAGASASDASGCTAVADAFGPPVPAYPGVDTVGCSAGFNGCTVDTNFGKYIRCTSPATTATGSNVNQRRFCACGQ